MNSLPEPGQNQFLGKIVVGRGDSVFEFVKPSQGEALLCSLPRKYNKLVYLKPGSFVIVERTAGETKKDGKINYEVVQILMEKQIKHLKQKNLWPIDFEDSGGKPTTSGSVESGGKSDTGSTRKGQVGLPSNDSDSDELVANKNRKVFVESSSDSEPE